MHRTIHVFPSKEANRVSKKPSAQLRAVGAAGAAKAPRKRREKSIQARVTKPDADVIVAYLPLELGRKVRMLHASSRISMSEIIAEALTQFFDAGAHIRS